MSKKREYIRIRNRRFFIKRMIRINGQKFFVIRDFGSHGRVRAQAVCRQAGVYQQYMLIEVPANRANRKRLRNLLSANGTGLPTPRVNQTAYFAGKLHIVIEWIPGISLRRYLDDVKDGMRPMLSPFQAIQLHSKFVCQIRTLSTKLGIFQGDISPSNLILAPNNVRLVLVDFGSSFDSSEIANHDTGDGSNLAYEAPEFTKSGTKNYLSEQFTCTMIFYEMLTNSIAYGGLGGSVVRAPDSRRDAILKMPSDFPETHSTKLPKPVWNLVDEFVSRGLALEPNNRFANSNDWINAAQKIYRMASLDPPEQLPSSLIAKAFEYWDSIRKWASKCYSSIKSISTYFL